MLLLPDRAKLTPPSLMRLATGAAASDVAGAKSHQETVSVPEGVSVVIPTQRRPDGLARAARSVFRQRGVGRACLELVIVDNDEAPSAAPVAASLRAEAPFPVVYAHEPAPGVANARNAGVTAARGALIAFLDDDEEASEGWLAALIEAQARFDADAVFGPVQARTPDDVGPHRSYLEAFFSRVGPAEAGVVAQAYGCGDSLVRRAALPDPTRPFNPARNETGGEDDLLFEAMRSRGARFAWAPGALVFEDPAPARLTLGYTFARAFAYGQGASCRCATADPPRWGGVLRWMAIGLAQALVYGLAAAAAWMLRAPDRAFVVDRAVRGLGKVLFGGPFKIQFYGRRAAEAPGQMPVG